MDAVVLCGGLGKRLRPEVGQGQKTMAAIHGRPFLDLLLQYLKAQGLSRVILCTGHYAEQVEAYYRDRDFGLEIVFSREEQPLGTGGAIKNAAAFVQSDPFLALNGDCFCRLDYRRFVDFYAARRARAVIALSKAEDRKDYGSVVIDAEDRIVRFEEKVGGPEDRREGKASSGYVSHGIYCFSRGIFALMPPAKQFSIERDFFPQLPRQIKDGFLGFVVTEPFIDIGTPERYQKAQGMFSPER